MGEALDTLSALRAAYDAAILVDDRGFVRGVNRDTFMQAEEWRLSLGEGDAVVVAALWNTAPATLGEAGLMLPWLHFPAWSADFIDALAGLYLAADPYDPRPRVLSGLTRAGDCLFPEWTRDLYHGAPLGASPEEERAAELLRCMSDLFHEDPVSAARVEPFLTEEELRPLWAHMTRRLLHYLHHEATP